MAVDFYIDPATNDLYIDPDTGSIRLTESVEELTRQRVSISLRTYLGEWFADTAFGTPYFQSIFGKGTKDVTDIAIRDVIESVEGVLKINSFESSVSTQRVYTLNVEIQTETGEVLAYEDVIDLAKGFRN